MQTSDNIEAINAALIAIFEAQNAAKKARMDALRAAKATPEYQADLAKRKAEANARAQARFKAKRAARADK